MMPIMNWRRKWLDSCELCTIAFKEEFGRNLGNALSLQLVISLIVQQGDLHGDMLDAKLEELL